MKCTRDVSTAYVLRSILICGVSVLYQLLFNTYENKRLCSLCSCNSHIIIMSRRMEKKQQSAQAKTKAPISFALTAELISAFVFSTWIVQFLYFLNPKFPASYHLLRLYRPVCVRPDRNPNCWFLTHRLIKEVEDATGEIQIIQINTEKNRGGGGGTSSSSPSWS